MAVRLDTLSDRASAGRAARSSRNRPTNSPAMCSASAALPPLPTIRILLSAASALVSTSVHRSSGSARRSRSAWRTRMLSSTSLRHSSATLSSRLDIAPGPQPLTLEREVGRFQAERLQRVADDVPPARSAVEQHEPAAARAGHLATEGTRAASGFVGLVDRGRGDAGGETLLLQPCLAHELAEGRQVPADEGLLHRDGQLFLTAKAGERVDFPAREARRLVVDDVVRHARRAREAQEEIALELVERLRRDAQRIDDDAIA